MPSYVFYTQPNAEKRAGESIRELGFAVFIPFEKRIRRRPNRKPQPFETALFPRYGFVEFNEADPWGKILDADGVCDILMSNDRPRPVQKSVIESLRLASGLGLFDRTQPHKVGQPAELMEGPFAGFIGKILRARAGDRVDLMIKFLGREVVTQAPISALKEAG